MSVLQYESLAVIIGVAKAKTMKTLQRRAHHEYGKQQPQESLLAPVLASHARIGCCIL